MEAIMIVLVLLIIVLIVLMIHFKIQSKKEKEILIDNLESLRTAHRKKYKGFDEREKTLIEKRNHYEKNLSEAHRKLNRLQIRFDRLFKIVSKTFGASNTNAIMNLTKDKTPILFLTGYLCYKSKDGEIIKNKNVTISLDKKGYNKECFTITREDKKRKKIPAYPYIRID